MVESEALEDLGLGGFKVCGGFGIETGWAKFPDLPQNIPGVLNLSVLHTRHALYTLYAPSTAYSLIQGLASGAAGWISPSEVRRLQFLKCVKGMIKVKVWVFKVPVQMLLNQSRTAHC